MLRQGRGRLVLTMLLGAMTELPAWGEVLHAGDILVLDPISLTVPGSTEIIRVDPVTGAQSLFGPGGVEYAGFLDMEMGADGLIYTSNSGGYPLVFALDPLTGASNVILDCFADLGSTCLGLGSDAAGLLHVANAGLDLGASADGSVYRSPGPLPLAAGGLLKNPWDVAVRADGDVLVADVGPSRVVRINGVTGGQSLVANLPAVPLRIVVDAAGDAIVRVSNNPSNGLLHVDVETGSVSTILSPLPLSFALAIEADGQLLASRNSPRRIIRVDPSSSAETIVSSGGLFQDILAVAVVRGCTSCPACSNHLDDDADGLFDFGEDPECASAADTTEALPACSNGIDDDGDGRSDYQVATSLRDFGCTDATDASESGAAVCDDGIDNDGDGGIDYRKAPALGDIGCSSHRSQIEAPQCQDGINNDLATGIDFDGGASANGGTPLDVPDPQCTAPTLGSEAPAVGGCGFGPELAFVMPLLAAARKRRERARPATRVPRVMTL